MKWNKQWLTVAIAAALTAWAAAPFVAQQPAGSTKDEVSLRAAIERETVQGDLKGAIEAYKKLESSKDRSVAARALLRMAESYRKLGDAQSREVYERIVQRYADQGEVAALARTRLGDGERAPQGNAGRAANDRVLLASDALFGDEGSVSPDGRYMTDVDYIFSGNLVLHDFVTGKDRTLTGSKDWSDGNTADTSTFSPDGRRIAYGWRNTPTSTVEIRIISLDEQGIPRPKQLIASTEAEASVYNPRDWSKDGKWLAVTIDRMDRTKQIAIVGVADAAVRVLKTVGWRGPYKVLFSPDAKYIAYCLPGNGTEAQRDVFVMSTDGRSETAVVQNPANDVLMGWSPDGGHLLFASDRSGQTGLWAVGIKDGKAPAAPFLVRPDIGSASPVGITASGSLVVVRDASTLGLYSAPVDLNAGKLAGPPVLQSFSSEYPTWSPDGQYLSYSFTGSGGGRTLAIRNMASGQVRQLRPALQYFRYMTWSPDSKWLITNGRDFNGRSGIFRIDAQTGATSVILDRQGNGATVSADGKKVYYGLGGWLVEQDLDSGNTKQIVRGGQGADLSPDGRMFAMVRNDDASKTSSVVVIPVEGGEPRELYQVRTPESVPAFTNMSWTPDGRALLVVKRWDRDERQELWRIPVYEGEARKLDIDISSWTVGLGIRLHPNGRQLAFFDGKSTREAFVYENVAKIKP